MNSELLETYAFEGENVVRTLKTAIGPRSSGVQNLADKDLPAAAAW